MSASGERVLIGLDLGTSGLKAVALGLDGAVVARASATYATHRPQPAASEQDPADWLAAVAQAVAVLAEQVPTPLWAGLGLSGMLPTLVTLDSGGEALGRALTWEDARADAHGESWRDEVGAERLYSRTGQWVDGRYLVPMYLRLLDAEPRRAASTALLAGAKDHLFAQLTGRVLTDPSTASGVGCYDLGARAWDRTLLGSHPVPALPDLAPSTTLGSLTAAAAALLGLPVGLPVALGAADSVLGALGLGVRQPGEAAYVAGTSTVVIGVSDHPLTDPEHRYLVTPMADEHTWGLEMDLLATGSAIRWLTRLTGRHDEAELMGLAAASAAGAGLYFLPYLAPGEQGALWDPHLRGSLVGLELSHSVGDLARALVEGIVLESRRCLAVLAESAGAGDLHVAGGSAADPWFRRQLADASGRRVLAPADGESDYSAIGAGVVLGRALGIDVPTSPGERLVTEPDPARAAWWEARARGFDAVRLRERGL